MTAVLKTSIAFGLALAFSVGPYAAFAAAGSDLPQTSRPTEESGFDKARALAPTFRLRPAPDTRATETETDGLGRNDNDCKFGCTDH